MPEELSLPKGAEHYRDGIERVFSWVDREISQREFDDLSWKSQQEDRQKPARFKAYTLDTYIDPTIINGGDINVWFVQLLMQAGHVKARKKKDGLIYYRRA